MSRWKAKATKRGKPCDFNSDIVPDWLDAEVKAAMGVVGVEDAFLFLKAQPETRTQIERRLRKKLDAIMAKYNPRVASAVRRGEQPDYDRIFEEMRAAIQPEVTALTTAEALRISVDTGIVFDPAVINAQAVEWARSYTYDLVTGITNTERNLVRQVERTFFETPGMTQGDLERLLGHAFGPVRAEMIAVTETTRAAAAGTNEMQRLFNETGLPMIRVWSTANDDLVCPICGPLNGQPESQWSGQFGLGPPAHVNCRCSIGLSAMDEEVHLEEARVLAAERDEMLREMGLLPEVVERAFSVEEAISHVQQALADVRQKTRLPEIIIRASNDGPLGATTFERGHPVITMNPERILANVNDKTRADVDFAAWFNGTARTNAALLDNTAKHEAGHVWIDQQRARFLTEGTAAGVELDKMWGQWESLFETQKQDMPLYGQSYNDPDEAFADSFASFIDDRPMPTAIAEWFVRWVK